MQRSNGTTACASCKHQRKKCTEKCVLAPFFPAEKGREFQAVHKVFGVSNVTKMVRNLKEEERGRAVESLVWEAICRHNDPVLGPFGEYRRVYEELKLYKSQYEPTGMVIGWNNAAPAANNNDGRTTTNNNNVVHNNNDNNNNNNNNSLNYIHSNGNNSVVGYNNYPINHPQNFEKLRRESDNGSTVILPARQHPINGFNQQYFIAGQYNPADTKSMESSLWDGVS
ncbi:LOB domain-containing protein 2-like [Ipomoea triloba]|uniref:LOB domain-containing protein 2-like n=1 Tax=Ipomoea triloba TaxID=35885 RepID=UPI00125D8677|nr:LOB domain-containing protein 2-like [Ipomoea triloba]